MDLLAEPPARSILEQGRHAYVAVAASAGPHVTPELYSVADGRLWCWTAHRTVKAKVIPQEPQVGVVVRSGSRAVVVTGEARRYDPADVHALPHALREPGALGRATLRFGLRNAADLGAFAGDLVSGRIGRSIPPRRVLVGIRPDRLAVLDSGRVELSLGEWATAPQDGPAPAGGSRDAVLAWETDGGPVALPARVDLEDQVAWIPPALVALAGIAGTARVGVVVDDYVAPGPAAKQGTLLRGTGTVDESGRVEITPERETEWHGAATSTTRTP